MKLVKNAIMLPLDGTMDSFTGGVYSSDGEFIADSIVYRGKQPCLQNHIESLHGTYIYGGCLFGHFGHFIWESLSRLYAIRQCKKYPILFISPNDKIYNIQKIWIQTLGISNEIYIIKKTTSVENLLYAPPGSAIQPLFITDDQTDSLKCKKFREGSSRKIWLSRAKLKYGNLDNEYLIEEELKKTGFEIIYPEELPLLDQIRQISTSSIVAGCDGSAFFSLLFAKNIYGKFFVFNRRRNIPPTITYVLQKRNIQFEQHIFQLEPVKEEWPMSIFHQPNIHQIVDILKYT